jgi:DNA-binding GntR family transcriptional regulator
VSDEYHPTRLPKSGSSAYERLRSAIIDGEFPPGAALVEGRVAHWCGLSRTPVREALVRLEEDGLVERKDGVVHVRWLAPEEILAIYEVRIVLEQEAARLAARNRTDFDRVEIGRLCQAFEDVEGHNQADIIRRNRDLHQAIWRAARNPILAELLARLNLLLGPQAVKTLEHPGRLGEVSVEHRAIAQAIIAADADAAATAAAAHFERARDLRLQAWANGTEPTGRPASGDRPE